MIIDKISGTPLNPCKGGADCLGDGEHYDKDGNLIDCCCGECEYYLYCFEEEVEEYFKNEIKSRIRKI